MSINMLGLLSSEILEELSHELSHVLSETLGRSQRQASFQTEKLICKEFRFLLLVFQFLAELREHAHSVLQFMSLSTNRCWISLRLDF